MPHKNKEDRKKALQAHYQKYKDKYLARDKERKAAARAFVDSHKNKPCMDCGGTFPTFVMDFDHVRGKKIKSLANACLFMWSNERLLAEIEKCDLVCANCHRIRTHSRYPKHE